MDSNPFFENLPSKKRNWFITILQSLVVLTSIGMVIYLFIISPNQVDGPSMEPNFYNNEVYFANRLVQWLNGTVIGDITGFKYNRGDVVVMQIPGYPSFIKRIIAIPGDKIAIRMGNVYINDSLILEEYLPTALYTRGGDFLEDGGESYVIPENSYFVMGDNRDVSYDSRFLGFIRSEWIKGKVFLKILPLNVFGLVSTGSIIFK